MHRKRLVLAVLGLIGLWAISFAQAQAPSESDEDSRPSHQSYHQNKTLADRFNDFGRTVFGVVLPAQQPRQTQSRQPHRPAASPTASPDDEEATTIQSPPKATPHKPNASATRVSPKTGTASSTGRSAAAVRTRKTDLPELSDPEETERSSLRTVPSLKPELAEQPASDTPSPSGSSARPLHERLKSFRESSFGYSGDVQTESALSKTTAPPGATVVEAADPPSEADQDSPGRRPSMGPPRPQVSADLASPDGARGGLQNPLNVQPKNPEAAALQQAVADRFAAQRAAREAARKTAADKPATSGSSGRPAVTMPSGISQPKSVAAMTPITAKPGKQEKQEKQEADDNMLFTRQSPVLSVETHGPRRITVGKESVYEVSMHNSGQVAANELVVTIELPQWADVLGADVSAGATQSLDSAGHTGQFQWKVGRLEARTKEKLVLRIVPRESRPFELGVKWTFTPVRSQTEIEVQEPKVVLNLQGPRDVLHGEKVVYKLELSNTGNGPAENLVVALTPIGPGENVAASHKLGTLAAGEKKVIEVELTARQAGVLTINVSVKGDGGVQVASSEKITVRQPVLGVKVAGPRVLYVGTHAAYQIRIANTGTAPAKNVRISATIPDGAEQLTALQEGRVSPDRKRVEWTFAEVTAGATQELVVDCNLAQAGSMRMAVDAAADGDLTASDAMSTEVEAMADLTLNVVDPGGPVPVGNESVYEIRVQNRGTKGAQNVEVVVYFSNGIEPSSADGAPNKIGPGQVLFSPIAMVAAGQTQVLKIKARAESPGNHIFRTEVYCRPLGVRLVSEQTTRFYGDPPASNKPMVAQPQPGKSAADEPPVRTAERPAVRSSNQPTLAPPRKN